MASKTLFLAALAVMSCVDAAWLPWTAQQQTRDLEKAPNNDFNINPVNSSTICLRLSTSISIQVQYKTSDNQDRLWQLVVPQLAEENVKGNCGPDAFLDLSWVPELTTQTPTPPTPTPTTAPPTPTPSSTSEPATSSTSEPATSSTSEPATSSTSEPATSSTPEPATSSTPEPATSSTPEPATSSTPEPATSSTPEPATSSTSEPATSSTPEPATSSTSEPATSSTSEPADPISQSESSFDSKMKSMKDEQPTHLRLRKRSLFEATASDSADANNLHFDFKKQEGSYFLGDIKGVINTVDAPEDFPANIEVISLSVTGQKLFTAPLGVVSMCSGSTVLQAKVEGSDLAVNITMSDVQMLAYWEQSYWPTQVKSCHPSSAAPKLDNMGTFVLGTVAALLANLVLW